MAHLPQDLRQSNVSNSSNSSDTFLFDVLKGIYEDIPEVRIFAVIFLFIFLTGIIGNGLVVFVFIRNKAYRTLTNIFLLNLAVVDLVYLVVCCPFSTVKVLLMYWPFGNILCKVVTYLMVVCMCVNVLTLVAIGLDRFLAIVLPVKSRTIRKKRNATIIVIGIWVLSLMAFTPIFIITRTVHGYETYCIEQLSQNSRVTYTTFMFLLLFVVPQVLLGYCYAMIARAIRQSRGCKGRMTQVALVTMKIRYRIVKMTFAVSLAFAVCWLPMHIAAILNAVGVEASYFTYYFQLYVPCFAYATVSLNPILYCFMSKTFRKSLKATFTCHRISFARPLLGDDADLIHQQTTPSNSNSNKSEYQELCAANHTAAATSTEKDNEGDLIPYSNESTPILYREDMLIDKECQTERSVIGDRLNVQMP